MSLRSRARSKTRRIRGQATGFREGSTFLEKTEISRIKRARSPIAERGQTVKGVAGQRALNLIPVKAAALKNRLRSKFARFGSLTFDPFGRNFRVP